MSLSLRAFCWLLFFGAATSWAQSSGKSLYLLNYSAPENCAAKEAFQQTVARHASDWESATDTKVTPSVSVALNSDPSREDFIAQVELLNREGQRSTRELRSAKCAELVEGSALIVSVFLAGLPEVRKPMAQVAPSLPVTKAQPEPWQWRTRAHAQGGLRSGMSPSLASFVWVGAEVFPVSTHWAAPHVRMMGGFAWSEAPTLFNPLQISAWLARVDFCPFQLTFGTKRPLALQSCLLAEGGEMRAAWANSPSSLRSGPWVAPGASGRLSWSLWRGLSLESEVFVTRPLVQNRFTLDTSELFTVPVVSAGGSAGLGWQF